MKNLKILFLLFICVILNGASKPHLKTRAVIFDLNGVIVKTDRQIIIDFIAKSLKISSDDVLQALIVLKKQNIYEEEDENDFWEHFAKGKGQELPLGWMEQYRLVRISAVKEIPGIVAVVKNLQKQGYKTALLTNTKKYKACLKGKSGVYELFQPIIFAYQVGVQKPDPKIYYAMLDQLKMSPEEVLFIDNKAANIAAAKQIKIDAIEFINTEQLIDALKKRGIDVCSDLQCD